MTVTPTGSVQYAQSNQQLAALVSTQDLDGAHLA
jgi:hypothetical protein